MNLSTNTSAEIITEIITRKYRSQKSALWSPLKILPTVGLDSAIYIRCLISQRGQPSGRPHAVRSMVTVKARSDSPAAAPRSWPAVLRTEYSQHPGYVPCGRHVIPHIHQKQPLSLDPGIHPAVLRLSDPIRIRLSVFLTISYADRLRLDNPRKKECAFAPSAHPCGALFCFIGRNFL